MHAGSSRNACAWKPNSDASKTNADADSRTTMPPDDDPALEHKQKPKPKPEDNDAQPKRPHGHVD